MKPRKEGITFHCCYDGCSHHKNQPVKRCHNHSDHEYVHICNFIIIINILIISLTTLTCNEEEGDKCFGVVSCHLIAADNCFKNSEDDHDGYHF